MNRGTMSLGTGGYLEDNCGARHTCGLGFALFSGRFSLSLCESGSHLLLGFLHRLLLRDSMDCSSSPGTFWAMLIQHIHYKGFYLSSSYVSMDNYIGYGQGASCF